MPAFEVVTDPRMRLVFGIVTRICPNIYRILQLIRTIFNAVLCDIHCNSSTPKTYADSNFMRLACPAKIELRSNRHGVGDSMFNCSHCTKLFSETQREKLRLGVRHFPKQWGSANHSRVSMRLSRTTAESFQCVIIST